MKLTPPKTSSEKAGGGELLLVLQIRHDRDIRKPKRQADVCQPLNNLQNRCLLLSSRARPRPFALFPLLTFYSYCVHPIIDNMIYL
jgi:hypothetical protein